MLDITLWIDVCQSDGNLLAACGYRDIQIFDKRVSKIVKTFDDVHASKILLLNFDFLEFTHLLGDIYCVRWDPSGSLLASASSDQRARVVDFKTGKVLLTGTTSDGSKL